jgi:hypothetical protein
MSTDKIALIVAEYNTLRAELLENKKYVFERPLLIITAAGIASLQLSNTVSAMWLPFLLITLLLINLWFTVNRLQSIARIAAYINVVLESYPEKWKGWETALRLHRKWHKAHDSDTQKDLIEPHIDKSAIPDAMMFYPPLFLLHVATVVVTLAVAIQSTPHYPLTKESIVSLLSTVGLACVFAVYCLGKFHPKKMTDLIERQRAIWIVVLGLESMQQPEQPD